MSWLAKITAVLSLLPAIIEAVRAVENLVSDSGQGAAKLQAIREILEAVSDQAASLWPEIQKVIAIIVALANKTGVFPK
jgi:hypothetical protein